MLGCQRVGAMSWPETRSRILYSTFDLRKIDATTSGGGRPTRLMLYTSHESPITGPESRITSHAHHAAAPWHFLYFFPLPQGQGSFRPTFAPVRTGLGA